VRRTNGQDAYCGSDTESQHNSTFGIEDENVTKIKYFGFKHISYCKKNTNIKIISRSDLKKTKQKLKQTEAKVKAMEEEIMEKKNEMDRLHKEARQPSAKSSKLAQKIAETEQLVIHFIFKSFTKYEKLNKCTFLIFTFSVISLTEKRVK